eukprot:6699880-Prymnesium_polylepis.1
MGAMWRGGLRSCRPTGVVSGSFHDATTPSQVTTPRRARARPTRRSRLRRSRPTRSRGRRSSGIAHGESAARRCRSPCGNANCAKNVDVLYEKTVTVRPASGKPWSFMTRTSGCTAAVTAAHGGLVKTCDGCPCPAREAFESTRCPHETALWT